MVKKLFKHEFIAYMRTLLPMYIVLIGISALTRFIYIFETESTVFRIIGTSSVIAVIVACVVAFVMTFLNIVTRFYKNLFTNEGYLSFTLPVTPSQHIFVKLITGLVSVFAVILLVILAVCIATAGQMTVELFKLAGYFIKHFSAMFHGHFWFYVAEIIVAVIVAFATTILLFYACITVGQLTRKNRVLASIGAYFVYYLITQVFGTIMVIFFTVIQTTHWFASVYSYILGHMFDFIHVGFGVYIVFEIILGFIFYIIARTIIKKKLNLE